jgi:hypothetical protein
LQTLSPHRSLQIEPTSEALRTFSEIHIDEDVRHLTGSFENALFHNCTFGSLNNLTLKNCVLSDSKFTETDPTQMLGFTVTLDCNSFSDVELTPQEFDLICLLLTKTKGNTEKRAKLIKDVVGIETSRRLLTKLKTLE